MMKPVHYIALSLALSLTGCASVTVTPMNPSVGTMAPRPADEVRLYLTKAPERDYEEVYLLRSDAPSADRAIEVLREKAGELGCDGIVLAGKSDRVVGTPDGRGGTTVSTREGYVGSCIVFS